MNKFIYLSRAAYDVWTALNINHIVRYYEDSSGGTTIVMSDIVEGGSYYFKTSDSFEEGTRKIKEAQG